jgi:membrane-associated phospholipid phosphatase
VLFGIYDLPISVGFVRPGSAWGGFVERFGELPGMVVIVIALLMLGTRSARTGGALSVARATGLFLLASMATLYATVVLLLGLGVGPAALERLGWFLWIPGLLLVAAAGMLSLRPALPPGSRAHPFALRTFRLALLNFILFVQPAKLLWGRIRFRDLDPTTFAGFTPWFSPQGPTGHFSFPSGHTALGWMLLPLLPLAAERPRFVQVALWLLVLGWGLFVAVGRVRIGAHYASDVLFPTALAFLICMTYRPREM